VRNLSVDQAPRLFLPLGPLRLSRRSPRLRPGEKDRLLGEPFKGRLRRGGPALRLRGGVRDRRLRVGVLDLELRFRGGIGEELFDFFFAATGLSDVYFRSFFTAMGGDGLFFGDLERRPLDRDLRRRGVRDFRRGGVRDLRAGERRLLGGVLERRLLCDFDRLFERRRFGELDRDRYRGLRFRGDVDPYRGRRGGGEERRRGGGDRRFVPEPEVFLCRVGCSKEFACFLNSCSFSGLTET